MKVGFGDDLEFVTSFTFGFADALVLVLAFTFGRLTPTAFLTFDFALGAGIRCLLSRLD